MKKEVNWEKYFNHYDIMMEKVNIPYQELEKFVAEEFSKFNLEKNSLILDIGTGTGRFAVQIAKIYPESTIIGVDIVAACENKLKEKAEKHSLKNLKFKIADITKAEELCGVLPEGRKADAVNCIHTLYLIPENQQMEVLKNFNMVLNKGGYLLISEIGGELKVDEWRKYFWQEAVNRYGIIESLYLFAIHARTLAAENRVIQKRQLGKLSPKLKMFSLDEFVDMVEDAGFEIISASDKYYRGIDRTVVAKKL